MASLCKGPNAAPGLSHGRVGTLISLLVIRGDLETCRSLGVGTLVAEGEADHRGVHTCSPWQCKR